MKLKINIEKYSNYSSDADKEVIKKEIEFDDKMFDEITRPLKTKKKVNSISPSSVSDVAYLSYLMRMEYDLDDYDEFLEIHPSSDTNYKIIKNMWL